MAVPKKRILAPGATSAAPRTRAAKPRLNECPRCHSPRLPHRVCPVCGTYAGREVISHEIGEAEPRRPAGERASRVSAGMTTVALDGRGAERGAEAIVAGARAAAADGIGVRVFGDPAELAALDGIAGVEVIEARRRDHQRRRPGRRRSAARPSASIVLAAADVAAGHSDALASAGPDRGDDDRGAVRAASACTASAGPALALQLVVARPRRPARRVLLDVGANAEVRPSRPGPVRLPRRGLQRGRARRRPAPRGAALGRRGGEEGHGRRWSRRTPSSRAPSEIDFRGNVEGRDLLGDAADVIVTDGFTGNVALKTIEGTARDGRRRGRRGGALEPGRRRRRAAAAPGASAACAGEMDPDTTGGAILLGLRGVAVVGHGSSGAGRDRERDPAGRARGRGRRGRAHGGAA